MSKLKIGLLAIAAGFMFQAVAVQPASALSVQKPVVAEKSDVTLARQRGHGMRRFGGGGQRHGIYGGGGRRHGIYGGGFRRHGFYGGGYRRHYYRPRIYIQPSYGYYNSCRWLKRKALYTGSHYWWRRYQHCRRGW